MSKTSPKLRFFSEQEKAILDKWAALPKGHQAPKQEVEAFCKKYNRTVTSIYQYKERFRKNLVDNNVASSNAKQPAVVKPTQDLSTLRRNEFVIPVTSWELRSENGQTNLILKFK